MADQAFIESVLDRTVMSQLVSESIGLKRRGREYVACCPFHNENTPSFTINDRKGFGHCFGCGWHGNAIQWLKDYSRLSFPEALEQLAVQAGLRQGRTPTAQHGAKPRPIVRTPECHDDDTGQRIEWARQMWSLSVSAQFSLVSIYLRNRGLALPERSPIKFVPDAWHSEARCKLPAMVAAVQGPDGKISGIHRTFLADDGGGKANVTPTKMAAGKVWGGAIRLCAAAPKMGIAEGIETALSVSQAGRLPTWSALSLGNMAAVELPPIVQELVLCVDADGDQAALESNIDKAVAFHSARGLTVRIARPEQGCDFNDMLRRA